METFTGKREKNKKHAIFLYNESLLYEPEFQALDKAVFQGLSHFVLVKTKDPDDVIKAFHLRPIKILILDNSLFQSDALAVDFALELKKINHECKIIFVPIHEDELLQCYRNKLFAYEENDDYIPMPADVNIISKRLRDFSQKESRTTKRFSLRNFNAQMEIIESGEKRDVQVSDLSLMSFACLLPEGLTLKKGTQLTINIPLYHFKYFHRQFGEFLKLAGKVQRVSLDGKQVGCSIEHITPLRLEALMVVIEQLSVVSKKNKSLEKGLKYMEQVN